MKDAKKRMCKLCLIPALAATPLSGMAQGVIKGTIYDSNNEPIIGASIVEKGNTKNGAVSDLDGNFTLTLKKGSKAVISYIGMISQEVGLGEKQIIVLKDNASDLGEVVVLGYTSRARKDLTGSVGSISGTKLAAVPVTSAAVALQGKIAGVQVTTVDGQPGADVNIRVRGTGSVTQSNDPLYIVDGFEAPNINDIPPSDIASIDVLKDASLTAIYGAKGGNGVIVVTTKSAAAGKIQVSFNGNLSISHLAKKLDLMNSAQFADYCWDRAAAGSTRSNAAKYFRANFGNPNDLDIYQRATTHDWQDEVMGETPLNYSANLTVGGGSDKIHFNTSLTNSQDNGIILGSGVRRTNLNIKLEAILSPKLTLKMNPKFSYRRDIGAGGDNIGSGGVIDVLRYRPTNGLREFAFWDPATVDPDEEANFAYTNPKNDIQTNTQKKHSYNITNQIALNWKPIKGLTIETNFSYRMYFNDTNRFYGPLTKTGQSNNKLPVAQITNSHREAYTWTNTANYNFKINKEHEFDFLLGSEIQNDQTKTTYQFNRYFPREIDSETALNNMTLGVPYQSTSSLTTPIRQASFFGQASWNYKHRYLAAVTMRADGSTKFAPENQWGYFPSVSGAWVLSEEPFMKNIKWINNLKIRASWGLAGNNRIDNDMWRYLYSVSTTGGPGFGEATENGEQYYSFGNGNKFTNEKVKWETSVKRNLAADISLFDNRLQITPELYWNTTKDLLYLSDIPSATGYTTQMRNIGQVSNTGVELTVNYDILRGKDYVLSANATFGYNKFKVDKLNETDNVIWDNNSRWYSSSAVTNNDYAIRVGDEVGLLYGYVYDGLYSADEFDFDPNQNFLAIPKKGTVIMDGIFNDSQSGTATLPGKIKFKDLDGDGKITEADRTNIGHTVPRYEGGFGLSGQWKGFDFAANFNYMLDFDIVNATAYQLSSSTSTSSTFYNVLSKFADNRWRYTRISDGENLYKNYYIDGALEEYISMNANATLWNPADITNNVLHSYFVENASFLRLQDVTIGYTLPRKLTARWGISKMRVYTSASNLFVITGYTGYDPEVDIQTSLCSGMDLNRYPRSRSFVFGVNVTF
ncbi:SusC/RagA family TonB-linked outer membrane protein [Segatella bryantii]|jgi:TonB-linked SusC/RagA family outer membrane protein|uniref:SusC/RagA family TonB-linked outer membrane protein n=1 Tax=Segatella bryantii TaxID=77095 RepID=UPI002430F7E5|nr:TonB-dependent receptor [Segatella bryantii]MBQ3857685.1 TonB-dependent receptor [Prevotella sp.]